MRKLPSLAKLNRGTSQNSIAVLTRDLKHTRPTFQRYGFAVLAVGLALAISLTFRDTFDPNPFLLFFGAVTFSAWYGGLRPGLLSVVLTVLTVNYFFFSPNMLEFSQNDLIRIVIFVLIATGVSTLYYLNVMRLREVNALQITLSSIEDGVIVSNTQSRVLYLNKKAEALTGWASDEARGKALSEVFTIVGRATHKLVENSTEQTLTPNDMLGLPNHSLLRSRNGGETPITDNGLTIRTQDGQELGAVLVFRDVIRERKAARALTESENRFRSIADTAPVMIWIANADKLYTYLNQPWFDFTGRSLEQELGMGWTDSVHLSDLEHCLDIYKSSFDNRENFTMEYRLRRYDGVYRWVLATGVPRYDADNHFIGYIGSCIDITDRKRGEVLIMTLQDITAALASAATVDDVAEVIVRNMIAVFGGSIASVAMLSDDGTQVNVIRRDGAPEAISKEFMTMAIDSDLPIVDCIREQSSIWLEDVEAYLSVYPHMTEIQQQTGTQAIVCIPLVVGQKTIGAVGIAFDKSVELTKTDRGFMMALAQHCAQAMERAQLSQKAKIAVALEERQRLARDLHDSISQSLYAITLTAETLPAAWHKEPDNMPEHLERLLRLGRGAQASMRVMMLELRPDQLVKGSIHEQFQQLATMLLGRRNIELTLEISPDIDEPRLPSSVHEALYRITQEALHNIVTYSTATQVAIRLTKESGTIKLHVQDNGKRSSQGDITPMLEIPKMRDQAEAIGASYDLTNVPQQGTLVTVEWQVAEA